MKVLFAVSNENISEAIIKKYPKEYKEILSYKNVYYFDAILKEIQRDKNYDRIVISEDLEPFINTNHDSIDNFIFEHLDRISDEAHDNEGKETAIILICSERRSPGSPILNKLFSIGVYNAVMGKDRNLQELCSLINRPRNKKEAKIYYRIDQATYDPVTENEVNEVEIQNILTHFKKLGKNTDRYADSFNNIAAQYTDEQLKIIVNVLPMKVKAILERESPKYQSLMGSVSNNYDKSQNIKEPGIKINAIGKGTQLNGPIVIPSNVKKANSRVDVNNQKTIISPHVSKSPNGSTNKRVNTTDTNTANTANVVNTASTVVNKSQPSKIVPQPVKVNKPPVNNVAIPKTNNVVAKPIIEKNENRVTVDIEANTNANADVNINTNLNTTTDITTDPNLDTDAINNEVITQTEDIQTKKRRGRPPKKVVVQSETSKPKGKRGRPPKNIVPNEEKITEDDNLLPGLDEDNILPEMSESKEILPGLNDVEDTLPGLDNINEMEIEKSEEEMLPGLNEDVSEEVDVSALLSGLDENEESDGDLLPGLDEEVLEETEEIDETEEMLNNTLSGINDLEEENIVSNLDDDFIDINAQEETVLPGMGIQDIMETEEKQEFDSNSNDSNFVSTVKSKINYSMSNLNSLLSKDKKIVTFIGTTKNGTSFLINNLALTFSLMGIDTAVLDMTKNRNSYYIFTNNTEELRKTAYASIGKLENGYADGIKFNKNFTVYTALPDDENTYENAEPILSTLIQNHSLVLIDCDFNTPPAYFASCQEIYLVQSMDILTIQPLTAFIRELKFKNAWEPEKARVVINKEMKVRGLSSKVIIAGMSRYNGPDMSVMTDLFNKDMIKACSIPFDEKVCSTYLETMATCKLTLSGYSKQFKQKMEILSEMVYPSLNSKKTYGAMNNNISNNSNMSNKNVFSNSTSDTLNQMKNRY